MASMLYFNGVDSVTISKRLGHAQVSTTADIYAHVMEEADQKVRGSNPLGRATKIPGFDRKSGVFITF